MPETRSSDFFFHYLVQQFQDKSVNICVQRFCTSFIFNSYSQAGLTDLMLCWVEALGMKWYEFLLCSCPSLTHSWECFPLRRAEEPWHSREQKLRQRTDISAGEPHINLPSWGRARAGIASPAPGCSDGSHRADWSISACHLWGLLTAVTGLDGSVPIVNTSQTTGS